MSRNRYPLRLLIIITSSIFTAELLLIVVFSYLRPMPTWKGALIDSVLLSAMVIPALYLFAFRPLVIQIAERRKAEEELRKHRDRLEKTVEGRTAELASTVSSLEREIVEHKLVEEALEETKYYLSSLIESSPVAIISTERDGSIALFNKGAEAMLGYAREDVLGRHVTMFYESDESAKEVMRQMRAGGGAVSAFETNLQDKDGELIPVLISASILYDKDGREDGTVGFNKDLRERKRVEEALKESEEKFRKISASAKDAIVLMDEEGIVSYWNEAAAEIFGYAEDEIVGESLHEYIIPERYKKRHLVGLETFKAEGKGNAIGKRLKMYALRRSGEEFPVELSLSSVKMKGRWNAIGIIRDLSEERKAEEQLRKLSSAVEQSASVVMITDTHGKIEYVNPKFEQSTGYSLQEAFGKNPRILKSGTQPAEFYEELWATITAGLEWRGEFHNRKKNGEHYWEFASISPIRDTEGQITHFLGIKEDVTERKLAEEKLQKTHHKLQEAYDTLEKAQASAIASEKLAAVGRLTAGVSHEVLNPLNAIILGLHILIHDHTTPPEIVSELVELDKHARRITKISQDLLFFARQRPPERRMLDLNEIVKSTLSLVEYDLRVKDIKVESDLKEGLLAVHADQDQLQQVVLNLLTNARDAMPKGGRLIIKTSEVEPLFDTGSTLLELRVEDSGPGIDPRHINKIFDPFFTTKPEGQGTGLGLSICQGIIENHEGTIWAENLDRGGVAFVMRLKAAEGLGDPTARA